MIVDDEYLVKVGVRNCLDWHYNGFNEPLEASNVGDALEILKRVPMDLIMTDIRMPYKDGFRLIESARQMGCSTEFIILSCHNDSEYRRLAQEYGACAYLFKPKMMPQDIQSAILKAKERIDQKRWKEQALNAPLTFLEETARAAKSEFLWSILEGKRFSEPDFIRCQDRYGLSLDYTNIAVMVLQSEENEDAPDYENGERIYRKIHEILNKEKNVKYKGESIYRSPSRHVILCSFIGGRAGMIGERQKLAKALVRGISGISDRRVWIGVGEFADNLSAAGGSYRQAAAAAEQHFFDCERAVLFSEEVLRGHEKSDPLRTGLPMAKKGAKQSIDELRCLADSFMLSREEFCEAASMLANELIKEKRMESIPGIQTQKLHLSVFKEIRQAGSAEEIFHFMEEFQKGYQWEEHLRTEVNQALGYIKENLGDCNLSIAAVAEKTGLSPNYLGRLFRQSMNMSFIEYLTEQRVERAKELLTNTNLKVYEIAEQVGYHDWRYFSKIYKKHTGFTLQQTRVEK